MRWNWSRQKQQQNIFKFVWERGIENKADYFTKHHPPNHHRLRRYDYLLRGTECICKVQKILIVIIIYTRMSTSALKPPSNQMYSLEREK